SLDRATSEAEERRNQGDTPAHRLQQLIKESDENDLASHFDHVDRETKPKQALVRHNIRSRSGSVAGNHEPLTHEALGEYSRQHGEKIKEACNSGLVTRRHLFNPLHHETGPHLTLHPRSACDCSSSRKVP